jgi:hypothetical protein
VTDEISVVHVFGTGKFLFFHVLLLATKRCDNLINTSRSPVTVVILHVAFHVKNKDKIKALTRYFTYRDHSASSGVYETKETQFISASV